MRKIKINIGTLLTALTAVLVLAHAAYASGPNFNDTTQQPVAPNPAGNVGIGTFQYTNRFNVEGGVAIGTYGAVNYVNNLAPAGGMIVQSNVGIGSVTPGTALDVNGTARMTGFTLSNNGATAGNILVTNGVWMREGHGWREAH